VIARLLSQRRAVNILFVVICGLGALAVNQLGREELPEFIEPGIAVTAYLPGGSPDEVDLKVARPLQDEIKDIPGVKEVESQSSEGVLSISVTFDVDDNEVEALNREIAQIVNQVPDLPPELEGPYVSRRHNRLFPALTILFQGGDDLARHVQWHRIQTSIEQMPEVDALEVFGDRERRAEIRLDPLLLERYGLRIDEVGHAVSQGLADRAAGRVESSLALNRLRTLAQPKTVKGLEELMVTGSAGGVRLSELGEIRDALEPARMKASYRGESSWYVNVYRRSGTNIETLSDRIKALVEHENTSFKNANQPFELLVLYDRSEVVARNLGTLAQSVALGILLVMAVLWLFLGAKHAAFAAIGIPFAFLVTFLAMDLMGMSLNMLTLFGLVLVCGMIVDDAIVVLENVGRYQQQGVPHVEAISRGVREVLPAVVASTFTTVAALLPLLLMAGGMGMYISQIPQVAILALLASLAECLVILPVHLFHARNPSAPPPLSGLMDRAADAFTIFSARSLDRPYRSLAVLAVLAIVTFTVAWWRMDFELFPSDETRTVRFYLEFTNGTDLDTTFKLSKFAARQIEAARPEVSHVVTIAGWRDYNYQRDTGSRFATLELQLSAGAMRNSDALALADTMAEELRRLPGLERLDRSLTTNAPPSGVPVQIYLYGDDANALAVASSRVRELLSSIPSIVHPTDPMNDGVLEDVFEVDRPAAQRYGIAPAEIGGLLHAAVTGIEAGRLDLGEEVLDVYVLAQQGDQQTHSSLNHLRLLDGQMVPLDKLGRFERRFSPNAVRRHQGKRFVAISADIDPEAMSVFRTHREIERLITPELLPPGITFEQQGEFSDTQESLTSMIQSAIIALGLSYFVLALLFRSYLQPVIVLMTVPLAYMGVVWGMTLLGQPLSLMGLVVIIGLIGIVVNDSLVWMSFYNREKERLGNVKEAALSAVRLRFRPIWLTTITTVFGLLPTSLAASAGIANAMAKTVVFGLASASLLLLVFLPLAMVVGNDLGRRYRSGRGEQVVASISTLESAA
jgi:multidrug efflux pump subunit AcrB